MFRVSAWENYQKFLRKAAPALTNPKMKAELEEAAAFLTNNTYQNYSFLNEGLKTLSKYGVLGQFAAFSLELMRNQYHQGLLIKRMLDGSLAQELAGKYGSSNAGVIRNEGIKRLVALSSVYAAATAGVTQFNRMFGNVEEDEERMLRESVLPDWDKNKELGIVREGDKVYHKNISYLFPHAEMAGVLRSALRGESFTDAAARSFQSMYEGVGGEGNFFINSLVPAIGNYVPGEEDKISTKEGMLENAAERAMWFANDAFRPGLFREIDKALSETNPQPAVQTMLRQGGIRINDTTIQDGAGFHVRDIKDDFRTIRSNLASAGYKLAGRELDAEYEKLNQNYRERFATLARHAQNYQGLGMTEDQVIKLLRDNGISGTDALNAVDGKVADLPRFTRDTASNRWDDMSGKTESEKTALIRSIEDKNMRETLIRKLKKEKEYERKGISERDKVVMGLGVGDGGRAQHIYDRMQQSGNPSQVLRDYIRKGVATKDVIRQIRIMQN
jgi:hypothetical protein